MKKKSSTALSSDLPISKQTAGGVTGAILGGVVGGPVGAVAGAIAGTIMGNRAAAGKSLVPSGTIKAAKTAVTAAKDKLPPLPEKSISRKTGAKAAKAVKKKAGPVKQTVASAKKAVGKTLSKTRQKTSKRGH